MNTSAGLFLQSLQTLFSIPNFPSQLTEKEESKNLGEEENTNIDSPTIVNIPINPMTENGNTEVESITKLEEPISSNVHPARGEPIPVKNKLPLSFSLALVKKVIMELEWDQKYQGKETTLRQAISDHLVEEFEKAKEPEIFQFFKLFNKLLDFEQSEEVLGNMNFFSKGSRIKLLFNEKFFLDIPVQKFAQLTPESDFKSFAVCDQNPTLKLLNLMNCFEKLNLIQDSCIEKLLKEMQFRLDGAKDQAIRECSNSKKSKVVRVTYSKEKLYLEGEDLAKNFFNKARGYQIYLKRFSSLREELSIMSTHNNQRLDQKCLQLNNLTHRLRKFLEFSSKQFDGLMLSYRTLMGVKPCSAVKEEKVVPSLLNLLPEKEKGTELGRYASFVQSFIQNMVDIQDMLESANNTTPIGQILACDQNFEKKITQYSELYYSFLKGMISYVHQQEALLTNSTATPEELQSTAEWMGSLLKAENKAKSSRITIQKKTSPRNSNAKKQSQNQPSPALAENSNSRSDLKNLVEKAQTLENKPKKISNKPKPKSKSTNRKNNGGKKQSNPAKKTQAGVPLEFNSDAFPLPPNKIAAAPAILSETTIFLQAAQNYCEEWNLAIKQVYEMNKERVEGGLFYQGAIAAFESDKHLLYSTIGLEQFCNAIKQQDWSALPQIVSMSILDLFVMNEQILRVAYIGKYNQLNNDAHDIVETAKAIDIYERLSTESQNHLYNLNRGTLWARYTENSLRYNHTRYNKTSFPRGLLAIEQSQLIASGKSQYRKHLKKHLNTVFGLFLQQCLTSYEIITAICGEPNEKFLLARNEFIEQIQLYQSKASLDLPRQINHLPKVIEGSKFSQEILQLQSLTDDIQWMMDRLDNKENLPSRSYLEEAHGHLKNFIETLHFCNENREPRSAAWTYRNCLKVQLVLESLYTCRNAFRSGYIIINHDLVKFHEKMNDADEMNPANFSFNKSMQYTSSHACHERALPKVKSLQRLEDAMEVMNREFDIEGELRYKECFNATLGEFVTEVLPLLIKHVEACKQDLLSAIA